MFSHVFPITAQSLFTIKVNLTWWWSDIRESCALRSVMILVMGECKRARASVTSPPALNHVSQKQPHCSSASLTGELWQCWGSCWDWSDQKAADHHLWQVWNIILSSFESSQVQIRHGQLAGGGRVDNWGPEKVRMNIESYQFNLVFLESQS